MSKEPINAHEVSGTILLYDEDGSGAATPLKVVSFERGLLTLETKTSFARITIQLRWAGTYWVREDVGTSHSIIQDDRYVIPLREY